MVALSDYLDWTDYEIPESNMAVRIARLRSDPVSRGFSAFVRFPEGWERPAAGSYTSEEEFVVLRGGLEISGKEYRQGEWVLVPAGATRFETSARPEALTFACFSGPARWTSEAGSPTADGVMTSRKLEPFGKAAQSPLGGQRAWLLQKGNSSASWLIHAPTEGSAAPFDAEIFGLDENVWAWVPANSRIPRFSGLCFCRTFGPTGRGLG